MDTNGQSAARRAFIHYLRTGRRLPSSAFEPPIEAKFNPYHDPRNGQFTFAPGGPRSLSRVIISDRRHPAVPATARRSNAAPTHSQSVDLPRRLAATGMFVDGTYRSDSEQNLLKLASRRPPPARGGFGSNSSAFHDPMTLQQVFPGLSRAPGGAILAMADNILDLTGPANQLTTSLTQEYADLLVRRIHVINPAYRVQSAAVPQTLEGQLNHLNNLRFELATAFYRFRGETGPLQVETLRFLQRATDAAYEDGMRLLKAGRLEIRLSPAEAVGNHIDATVRKQIKAMYDWYGISRAKGQRVRVNGREYDTSGTDLTFRRPDIRVGNAAFDVTLTRKTMSTPQIQGFFNADFKPETVIIIRPSQLGSNSSYIITRVRN